MTSTEVARRRIEQAAGLATILDAAYAAFEELLALLRIHEEMGGALVAPFLLAATRAANGRDAVLFAPSLPPTPLHRDQPEDPGEPCTRAGSVKEAASATAELSEALAARLIVAVGLAGSHRDRVACREAARYAQEIHDLAAGLAR